MKMRIAILAACASTLALALAATTGTFAKAETGFEKTFLDGLASKVRNRLLRTEGTNDREGNQTE